MEDGYLYPSIYMKIHGQPCLFIRNFRKSQASNSIPATCGTLAFFNGVLQSHLAPAQQGSASPTIKPIPSSSNKGNHDGLVKLRELPLWVISVITTGPVNRVMLLMQCQNETIKSCRLSHPYKGIGDCFARTVRNEGIRSLWKGNTAYMIHSITFQMIRDDTFDYFRRLFKKDKDSPKKHIAKVFAADFFSRAITLFLVHPLVYAQTRMANDIITKSYIEKRQFNGLIDVFKKTLKSDGIAGIYRGYNISFVASFVNDMLRVVLRQNPPLEMLGFQHSHLNQIIGTVGDTVFVYLVTYPAYTVVGRMMMMRSGEAIKYKSCFNVVSQIIRNEGVKSLYKGTSAVVIEFAVQCGLAICTYVCIKYVSGRNGQPTYSSQIKWKSSEDGGQSKR